MVDAARRHFERAGPSYTQRRQRWPLGPLRAAEQRAVQEIATVAAGNSALDAGCGDGEILARLIAAGTRSVGVDVARSMVSHCQQRGFSACVQDMQQLGFRTTFDWVFCIGSLEFIPQPQLALRSFADCLSPGGQLVLLFPHRGWLGWLYAIYHRSHGVRIHLFSRPQMIGLLAAAGLAARRWRRCALSTVCVAERLP